MSRLNVRAAGRLVMPRSLRYQLLSRSLFVLAGLLVLIGVLQYVLMNQFLIQNKASAMRNQVMSVPHEMWFIPPGDLPDDADGKQNDLPDHDDPGRGKRSLEDMEQDRERLLNTPDTAIAIVDTNLNYKALSGSEDEICAEAIELPSSQYKAVLDSGNGTYSVEKNANGIKLIVVLQPVEERGKQLGLVQISVDTAQLYDVLIRQLMIFLSLACLALVLGIAAFLPVIRRTLDPLSRMVYTVGQIDAGSLTKRLDERQGQAEVDRLAHSFNAMMERLETSFEAEKEAKEQMRRFVADASHELRTPLTSIHGFVEVLLRGAANQPDQLHRALESMRGESARIIKLVQDLLLLAKLDRSPALELTAGDIGALVREMEPQLRILAGARQVDIRMEPCAAIRFDPDKIKQVVLNLFHNAVQHTDPVEGSIEVAVTPLARTHEEEGVTLTIRDNGPGIAQEHLPHLLERFYRVDASRTRKNGGAGLGLSITKSIVDAHGGWIGVESIEGEGSAFHVHLPARPKLPALPEHAQ